MTPSLPAEACWDCERTVNRYFQYLDDGLPEDAAGLFMPDGVWVRRGERFVGRPAILSAMRERGGVITRHLVNNMVVAAAETGASLRYYLTVFAFVGEASGPAPLSAPHSIQVCEDTMVLADSRWMFSSRSSRIVFLSGTTLKK